MSDFVDEDHCSLCSRMWPSEREAFRANLDAIPLKEPVCNQCLKAWARNIGFPGATMTRRSIRTAGPCGTFREKYYGI